MPNGKLMRIAIALIAGAATSPVSAEWFLDIYAGKSFMERTDVDISTDDVRVPGVDVLQGNLRDVELNDFTSFGLRVGRWFESAPNVGLALDVSRFAPDLGTQTVRGNANANFSADILDTPINFRVGASRNVRIPNEDVPVTLVISPLELMVRRPLLVTEAVPDGRLKPYLTAGPAFLITSLAPDATLGVKAGAGVIWQLSDRIGIFGEYRFTYFPVDTQTGGVNIAGVETGDLDIEADLSTHHILVGLSVGLGKIE
jgi:opacity protein-like surface antigen